MHRQSTTYPVSQKADVTSVVDRLLGHAVRTPNQPAVVEGSRTISYAEFVDRVMEFAALFAESRRRRVLIALEKGFVAYAAMFGSLMAGGIYAPVNVASTKERLCHICETFDPDIIVAAKPLASDLSEFSSGRMIDPLARFSARHRDIRSPDPIAYVIFTSGSTGAPKGVAIPRTALDHYVNWLGPAMELQPGDRLSQHPNIGFDLSVLDIYGALCYGASLHPFIDRGARLLPARKVQDDGITVWNSVPSVLSIMETAKELDREHLQSVRLFTFCGEVLRTDHVAKIFKARPDAVVLNTYGPTEATVAMTCRRLTADNYAAACTSSAPIGDPIGDMRLDLIGGSDEGEIVISGPQLAAGYWLDDALTAEKFRDFEVGGKVTKAFYTGDYAVRRNGEVHFLGRKDDMIKLRGHRMHLGAVYQALQRVGWASSFVFEKNGSLFAVVERLGDEVFDEARIQADLSHILESYAMPAEIRLTDKLPRNNNDKVDASAVKLMFEGGS